MHDRWWVDSRPSERRSRQWKNGETACRRGLQNAKHTRILVLQLGNLFDKSVIVLGQAYWSFEGLTTQVKCVEALGETFSRPTI